MSLDADSIVDRRRLKRRLMVWRTLAVIAITLGVISIFNNFDGLPGGDYVARLDVSNIIVEDSLREDALRALTDDDRARALIVRIDSPGGSVVGGESLFYALRGVAAEKPVVAVMGSLATSAGYMVAIAADHLVARQGTVTGSIGVLLQTADVTGLLEKIGVKPEIIKSGPLKAQPNPFETTTPEARVAIRKVILDMQDMFKGLVGERRNITGERLETVSDGRIFSGGQALEMGLVDALGGEKKARQWLAEARNVAETLPVRDVEIDYGDEKWRRLVSGFFGKTLFSERLSLDGLVSLWQPVVW
ncbi:MAG: signal peptide peptidase SppA [Alphaproteobacteria bacterium]